MFPFVRRSTPITSDCYSYEKNAAEKDVHLFLQSAQKVADDILGPEKSRTYYHCECVGRVKTRHFWMWWPISPYYVDPYPYGRRGIYTSTHDSESSLRVVVGLAAAVLGGYAIFKIVEGLGRRHEASVELKDNWEFKSKMRVYHHLFPDFPYQSEIKQIADLKQTIFARIKSDASWNLAMMVSVVAASAFALLGAIAASGGLMVIGASAGLMTSVVMLCRWSVDTTMRRNKHEARLIRNCLATIQ